MGAESHTLPKIKTSTALLYTFFQFRKVQGSVFTWGELFGSEIGVHLTGMVKQLSFKKKEKKKEARKEQTHCEEVQKARRSSLNKLILTR